MSARAFADLMRGVPFHTEAEMREAMDQPTCRWCREPVIRGLPCDCDRAQRELASIRAGTER